MPHTTAILPLRTNKQERLAVWRLIGGQRQSFNRGIEHVVTAAEADEKPPSTFDAYYQLAEDRRSGRLAKDIPSDIQRSGLVQGLESGKKWNKARLKHKQKVEYWHTRRHAAILDRYGRAAEAKEKRKEIDCRRSMLKDAPDEELAYCKRKHDKARQRRDNHTAKGTRRLFRSRKQLESEPRNIQALSVLQNTLLHADGRVRLPGGTMLRLMCPDWRPPPGHRWTGAVQVVDCTRKVTRKTRPEHRKYALHAQLEVMVQPRPEPQSEDDVIGVDAGVVQHLALSDGRMMNLPDEAAINDEIAALKRRRSGCDYGSAQWKRRSRRIERLYRRRTNLRDDAMRHIAKNVVGSPGVLMVGAEATNNQGMVASASGTKKHPGRQVAQKRGLNRSLSDARFAGIRSCLQRACSMSGLIYKSVPAAGTSQFCHKCGATGSRDTQADFRCMECGWAGNADTNSAVNVQSMAFSAFRAEKAIDSKSAAGAVVVRGSCQGDPGTAGSVSVALSKQMRDVAELPAPAT